MNRLQYETSPYLLQHAHNPVDWYAWKPEAFERAKAEDKPILVSIGYSTCHWCHVMERESFEDPDTADIMNEYFINIKVDREERPDVDQIYMDACQLISGNGGWPLNCFLTPDGRPFFAGTYYPPQPAYQRPSWRQVLNNMAQAYAHKRDVVEEQANKLYDIIKNGDKNFIKKIDNPALLEPQQDNSPFNTVLLDKIFKALADRFDREEGGFGGAPKFPGTMGLQYLLAYHHYTGNQEALDHVNLSLQKMIQGGIYDQLGGGFARYATDRAWLIPHFEKMLYDNALLVQVLSEAYKVTKNSLYKETIEDTLAFVAREMTHPEGGFFSAYDADSEGVEGQFYVWSHAEITAILGEDAPIFCAFYDVSPEGNWEETNILWRPLSATDFYTRHQDDLLQNIDFEIFIEKMAAARARLFEVRSGRPKPGLDDKILLSWNALMVSAYAKAYEALGHAAYRETAVQQIDFILSKMRQPNDIGLFHTFKNNTPQYAAFLEDYAFLTEALLDVYAITFQKRYLYEAKAYADYVETHFFDPTDNLCFFTSAQQTDIILRKKDLYDSATPSGNATMLKTWLRLAAIFDDKASYQKAVHMLLPVLDSVRLYPSSFSKWALSAVALVHTPVEWAILGEKAYDYAAKIGQHYWPNGLIMATNRPEEVYKWPLLRGRYQSGQTTIYKCQNHTCERPTTELSDVLAAH